MLTLPGLAVSFAILTLLAIGPLQSMDSALQANYAFLHMPWLSPFLRSVLDPIAGQTVCLPIMIVVAVVVAWRNRSWRPLLPAAAAELGFYGFVGGLKVLFARPSTALGDPSFFAGGFFDDAWHGIAYPSGHAAESILIYGTTVYILHRYAGVTGRPLRWLCVAVGVIMVNAVTVSFLLGWHWSTDLLAGWIAGAFVLRSIILLDRRGWFLHRLRSDQGTVSDFDHAPRRPASL